jgi:7-carboxy-7-deazaguanine synthase
MSTKKIPLVELFGPTIQGEGSVIGHQTYFLRFGLCDYKCKMCDSMHAVDPLEVKKNATYLTQQEIFDKLTAFRIPNSTMNITYSGGNPAIHDLDWLTTLLRTEGWKINVETQGTKTPDWMFNVHSITCSPKGPGMGEKTDINELDYFVNKYANDPRFRVNYNMSLKFVIFDQRDMEFAKMLIERYLVEYPIPVYLSLGNAHPPGRDEGIDDYLLHQEMLVNYRALFDEIKDDPILSQVAFLPQWHTFVWGNAKGK